VCELAQNLTKTFHGIRGFIDHSECTKEGGGGGGERGEKKKRPGRGSPPEIFQTVATPGNKIFFLLGATGF